MVSLGVNVGTIVDDERGLSSALGVTLMLGFSFAVVGAVILLGSAAISDLESQASTEQAESAFTQLDARAAQVALGESEVQTVQLGSVAHGKGTVTVDESAGHMTVQSLAPDGSVDDTIMSVDMGAVIYENGEKTIAYQGGGVWRATDGGSRMVSPPEFHYRNATLTLPLVRVTGTGPSSGEEFSMRSDGRTQYYPDAGGVGVNPLDDGTILVTVESAYYEAWGDYFERRTEGNVVNVDHVNQEVEIELEVPVESITVGGALSSTGGGQLKLETSGTADTYNSSEGPYDPATAEPAPIRTAGDVKVENNIEGNVFAEGDITVDGATLDGNACAEGAIDDSSGTVNGWTNDTTCDISIPSFPSPDSEIQGEISDHQSPGSNANGGTSCISGNQIVSDCTGGDRLAAGTYYLTDGVISENIDFDTSSGQVSLVIDDNAKISGASTEWDIVNSDPTHGVTVYIDGTLKVEGDTSSDGPEVRTDSNQSADLMVFKIASGNDVKFEKASHVEGVIFAPRSGCGSETVKLETDAEIYGALVAECPDTIETVGTLHYDQALGDEGGSGISIKDPISYLHVSTNEVKIEDN